MAPNFVTRSYGGGAEVAQLLEAIGPTDTSFTISTTVGWVETAGPNIGQPLGTSGPFEIILDRFSSTAEKMLGESVNLTTGVVTLYTAGGYNPRGNDGTDPVAHVPGTQGGVQTCWSAQEAFEANSATSYILGSAGGTPTSGQAMTWNGTHPEWATVSGLQSISLFGIGGATVGSPPPRLTGNFLMQAGLLVGVTDAFGVIALTFPETFSGIIGVWGINAQNSGSHFWVECTTGTTTTSGVHFSCLQSISLGLALSAVSIPWIAIGF